jgi:hypothetical protein
VGISLSNDFASLCKHWLWVYWSTTDVELVGYYT